jgi:hypothetical protein
MFQVFLSSQHPSTSLTGTVSGFKRRSSLQPARSRPTSTLQCVFLYSTLWILNHTTLNSQLEFSDDDWTPDQAAPTVSTRR